MNSDSKENVQSSSSKVNKKSHGDKYWIVYPNSEQFGHLSLEEVIQLVKKNEEQIFLIKNKQKNAVFTIDFFKDEFILKREDKIEVENGNFLGSQQRNMSQLFDNSVSSEPRKESTENR